MQWKSQKTVTTMCLHFDEDEREDDGSRDWDSIKRVSRRKFRIKERGHFRSRGRCNQERTRFWSARGLSNVPRNGCSSWKQKELPKLIRWSKAEHVLFGWRPKQQASCQCHWKRKSPVFERSWPPHAQRHQETNLRRNHDCAKISSPTQSRRRGCG